MLFRKIVHFSLAVLLLLTTAGISLSKHYCMGRLKSVAFYTHANNCTSGDFEDHMPCCEDTHEVLQVQDYLALDFAFESQTDLHLLATIDWSAEVTESITYHTVSFATDRSPPPDLVLLYENFRL